MTSYSILILFFTLDFFEPLLKHTPKCFYSSNCSERFNAAFCTIACF
jgi:hypothetical protein